MFKRTKVKLTYENEKIPYTIVSHRNYVPDFILTFPDGHKRYIEIKGYLRPEDRVKMKLVKDQHPQMDIRIVFAKDNKMNKNSKTMYSTWAKKVGIPYAIGKIPANWRNRNG
jgi:predicted nuclease of restriction endonuclease-like RecB superfamily